MEQTDNKVDQRLKDFRTVQGRLDSFLLNYGPVAVLAQFNLTGIVVILAGLYVERSPNPVMPTWAVVSWVYGGVLLTLFLEALVVRDFLKRIPETLLRLWKSHVIKRDDDDQQVSKEFERFLAGFEQWLNSRHRLWLALPMSVLGLAFFWNTGHIPYVLGKWGEGIDWVAKLVITIVNVGALFVPAVLVGYALGVGIWKSVVTAIHVRYFSRKFDFDIQLNHPDKAGGLKPLGDLILSMATILIVASLALSGVILLADYYAFEITESYTKIFLGAAIVLSVVIFFWPLLIAHQRMVEEKSRLDQLLLEITQRIAELEHVTQSNLRTMNYKKRQEAFSEIDSLTDLYRRVTRMPTWPFDREILLRFATPQALSFLSLIGVAEPIVSAIRSLVLSLAGQ